MSVLPFQIDSRSTHANTEELLSSFTDLQAEWHQYLQFLESTDDKDVQAIGVKMISDLINIWDSNEEIHHVVAAVANDYWRQFAYWRQPFEMIHYGQQLHVLGSIYNLVRSYINEHNMVKRGDLNHNDLPVYNASSQSFQNEQ